MISRLKVNDIKFNDPGLKGQLPQVQWSRGLQVNDLKFNDPRGRSQWPQQEIINTSKYLRNTRIAVLHELKLHFRPHSTHV